ncbi:DUF2441 domain-containing protein [Neopusillimonas maritima]|uniref:DUF2441 domain-containing protein n=1 Tax=Neopusillimonas maritima TaxID=2026239 RepID=UPI001C56C152|nr:DUF2441 domain-containing protein [Neopusillimonas maritima]
MTHPSIPARRRIGSTDYNVIYDGGILFMPTNDATPAELRYVAPMFLEVGAIIPPGNFGKNIMAHTPERMNGWMLARELIMERVRLQVAPHLPSRLNCCFLFTSDVAAFHGAADLTTGLLAPCIYKVELVNPSAPSCFGDYDTVRTIDEKRFFESVTQVAQQYWASASTGQLREGCLPEFLTLSPVRVVQKINIPSHDHLFPVTKSGHTLGSATQPDPS